MIDIYQLYLIFATVPGQVRLCIYICSLGLSTKPSILVHQSRVLARILDLGRVSNDLGVHMSITLNSQLYSPTTDIACGCSMLCNQIQGEHTLIYSAVTLEY